MVDEKKKESIERQENLQNCSIEQSKIRSQIEKSTSEINILTEKRQGEEIEKESKSLQKPVHSWAYFFRQ